ncbi:dihydrofolate reductase family protein [Phytomonospora sp. NPDC050363]|uniref:dihydrofolate reductase family protein n=1 Tax=Phytomonospora sp. NPDC050363 TaxID=3155642 RepID=UPI0033D34DEC
MRKLIVSTMVGLDGCFDGPNRDLGRLPMDDFFSVHNAERMRAADVLLFSGRLTYQDFLGFWPARLDSDETVLRVIAERCEVVAKVVVSDRIAENPEGRWAASTTVVRRVDAADRLTAVKREGGGDIVMFGGRALANSLFAAGLVDELHVMVAPVMVPDGIRAFDEDVLPALRLVDVRRFDGSQNTLITYERVPAR